MKHGTRGYKSNLILLLASVFIYGGAHAQSREIIMEGFWWNYWNNNYPNAWATYLTDLSPRIGKLGIDMVWVPPSIKNSASSSVGYSPFDAYDLGDKYQKGSTSTRFGNKDQYLRAVAVMHANGLGVIQDVVLQHCSDAGSQNGSGGQDPESTYSMKTDNGYKNFRYVSFTTPVTDESQSDYFSRAGRWPKNYENFYPNQWADSTSGDWAAGFWGPAFCYTDARAYGTSSNVTGFNPAQYSGYNRTEARHWVVWMKKQTGVDGFRWDAAKNYPWYIIQDLSWNLKYNAGFSNGGLNMFNVGEYVGSASQEDTYDYNVKTSNGGTEELIGTFDFSLRQEFANMVHASGSYNLGTLINAQQTDRYRTVPFVNNHDTFRPVLDANGNITGWDTGNELGGGHIASDDPRVSLAYAIALSVDGSPQLFFEDVFDLTSTGKRFTHMPSNSAQLPVRPDIANLIWCRKNLNFMAGAYLVRSQGPDILIIERSGKAIIGTNDNYTTWQSATIQTNFPSGTQLHDYSGSNATDIFVNSSGQAVINVPPCNNSAARNGYCVFGPAGISASFTPAQNTTQQEWDMADDLGDSHPNSLQQGGTLPKNSFTWRYAGQVYCQGGTSLTVNVYPKDSTQKIRVLAYNLPCSGQPDSISNSGFGNIKASAIVKDTGYYTILVRNDSITNPTQEVFVNALYTAPRVLSTCSITTSIRPVPGAGAEFIVFPNPARDNITISYQLRQNSWVTIEVFNILGDKVAEVENQFQSAGSFQTNVSTEQLNAGVYAIRFSSNEKVSASRIVIYK